MQLTNEQGSSRNLSTAKADFRCSHMPSCESRQPQIVPALPQPLGGEIAPAAVLRDSCGLWCAAKATPGDSSHIPPSHRSCPWPSPVPFAVVQGAAGSEGFVVVFPPPQQGHHGPKGSKQPCKHHHGDGCAPLQLAPCGKRKGGLCAWN